ncbi:MAG: dipeptidase [Sphingomonas bacterium]|nr:dipeptidase [Sphingomonas bacterium]
MIAQLCRAAALAALFPIPFIATPACADDVPQRIERILARAPVIDGHNDLAWEIRENQGAKVEAVDLTRPTDALPQPLQTDIARLRKGHVGAQFWSVYIPAETPGPRAVEMTLEEIDIARRFVAANPRAFAMATTADDIRRIEREGRIASLLGVEGGHQIDGRLSMLRQYKALGVGYMTLTHSKSLEWADSSTDEPRAGGLSAFGKQVVREMNRIGMIVDISHVADTTMRDALAVSTAPVIASHSGARAITDAPRNIPDDLLTAIATNGGVVMVNFYPAFLSNRWRAWDKARTDFAKSQGVSGSAYGPRAPAPLVAWDTAHPEPQATAKDVADHIDHIVAVAGHDHVGIGGDYDGIGGTGPAGMKGVDGYPRVFEELARRGWSDDDLVKLSSGNMLRVMERVEAVAQSMAGTPPIDATAR